MRLYPVVHINEVATATEQAEIALDAGADGVYLIDHHARSDDALFATFNDLSERRDGAYVGVNLLRYGPARAVRALSGAVWQGRLARSPDALWSDDICEGSATGEAKLLRDADDRVQMMRILGGVAFKYSAGYTEDPRQLRRAVDVSRNALDVVVTSGPGTGIAPPLAKVRTMKWRAQKQGLPLAVASGISLENIDEYKGIVDEVLVASSVETEPYSGVFDQERLAAFIRRAHEQ